MKKKKTVQAQQRLQKCDPDSAPSKSTICYQFTEFERGRTDTDDGERFGRPIEWLLQKTPTEKSTNWLYLIVN